MGTICRCGKQIALEDEGKAWRHQNGENLCYGEGHLLFRLVSASPVDYWEGAGLIAREPVLV